MWENAEVDRFYREFGRRLREERNRRGLSQEAVARSVGLTRTSVTNIEKGRQHVALHTAFVLAETLESDPHALLPEARELAEQRSLAPLLEGFHPAQQEWVRRVVGHQATGEEDQA